MEISKRYTPWFHQARCNICLTNQQKWERLAGSWLASGAYCPLIPFEIFAWMRNPKWWCGTRSFDSVLTVPPLHYRTSDILLRSGWRNAPRSINNGDAMSWHASHLRHLIPSHLSLATHPCFQTPRLAHTKSPAADVISPCRGRHGKYLKKLLP